jgi:hypothetical protein
MSHLTQSRPTAPHRLLDLLASLATIVLLVAAASCSATTDSAEPAGTPATTSRRLARELRLNDIQVLGSHNSYHVAPAPELAALLNSYLPGLTTAWEYTHAPLTEQFAAAGVRQIELDVFADPDGGRYAGRKLNPLLGKPEAVADDAYSKPGFKVFHVQEIDFGTTCVLFVDCLRSVKEWSDANPGHVPIMVLVEAKDTPVPDPLNLGFVQPLPIDAAQLDAIDQEIRSVFAEDDLITPDLVRGDAATLEQAVLDSGWPRLDDVRGRVMFALDNGDLRDEYAAGHPSLRGRVMFTSAEPGEPEAAFVKRNDAKSELAEIQDLVRRGYLVRTRSDADTQQARTGDVSMRDAALESGAHWVSTDYEVADTTFGNGYVVTIPGGTPARCNPLVAPPGCESTDIEDPAALKR